MQKLTATSRDGPIAREQAVLLAQKAVQ